MTDPIIIAGGGIGGLTTAIALAQRGFEVEVFERAPELRGSGAGITVQRNAMFVMQELGLQSALTAAGRPMDMARMMERSGAMLQQLEFAELPGPPLAGVSIRRSSLLSCLADAYQSPITFGAQVVGYDDHDDHVAVTFADGTTCRASALIGCDGLHSEVRRVMRGEDPMVYSGYTTWRGIARPEDFSFPMTEIIGEGERFGIVPIGHDEVYWFAAANTPEGGSDGPDPLAELRERFTDWPAEVATVLAATDAGEVIRTDVYDRDPITRWTAGRVGLLGDAAHPMTPNLGQGAGQAIEDAMALAQTFDLADVSASLRAYESRRVRRANWFVTQSRRMGQMFQLENGLARGLRNLAIKATPDFVMRRNVEEMYTPRF